ncbi:MAG: U32 family peptidase, partial [Planctomycetota bacterium]
VILARELSLTDVGACAEAAHQHGIEIEHFVHGALCYAFSGQCLMSNFAGCRSANRGTCAQNCRFAYSRNGAAPDTEISMRDLALVDQVGALAEAGVASLKIEGRLKGPDYVFTISRAYREAVDAWAEHRAVKSEIAREPLTDVFARPFTSSPLDGTYGPEARLHRCDPRRDRTPDAELLALDRHAGTAHISMQRAPEAGQGFAFSVGMFQDGFLVTAVDPAGTGRWRLRIRIDPRGPRAPAGTPLFRNRDQRRTRDAAQAMASAPLPSEDRGGLPVDLVISGNAGEPLQMTARVADGRHATIASSELLVPASGRPLDAATLSDSAGAFGGSGFILRQLDARLGTGLFMPASVLKKLRRQLVELLITQPQATAPPYEPPALGEPRRRSTGLWVAVGSLEAANAAFAAGANRVVLDDPTLDLWSAQAPVLPHIPHLWLRHPATAPVSPHLAAIGLPVLAGHIGVLAAARTAGLPAAADLFLNVYSTATLLSLGDVRATACVLSLELSGREVARLAARCATIAAP